MRRIECALQTTRCLRRWPISDNTYFPLAPLGFCLPRPTSQGKVGQGPLHGIDGPQQFPSGPCGSVVITQISGAIAPKCTATHRCMWVHHAQHLAPNGTHTVLWVAFFFWDVRIHDNLFPHLLRSYPVHVGLQQGDGGMRGLHPIDLQQGKDDRNTDLGAIAPKFKTKLYGGNRYSNPFNIPVARCDVATGLRLP